jgi:cyclopropane fatty-acyl-phospholipid synthase-like methyltransferase
MKMSDGRMRERFDEIYRGSPLDEIPWNSETPPDLLVELVNSGRVRPCKAIDMGCGAGNYAIYLASRGFDVIGVDLSPEAVKIAEDNARKRGVKCKFIAADVAGDIPSLRGRFGFIYDWGLLHHIMPARRRRYVRNVHRLLDSSGYYLSLCFNERDTAFEGAGKYRSTRFGHKVYLSSADELWKLWQPFFAVLDFRVLDIRGKSMSHVFNYCLMQRE